MIFTDLPTDYIKQINTLLFQFLWSGHDKISRNKIFQDMFHGGLGLPSVLHKRESIKIQTLRRIELNLDQPLANIYLLVWPEFKILSCTICCKHIST